MSASVDAEKSVIGILCMDPLLLFEARRLLQPAMFEMETLRNIYTAMCDIQDAGQRPDIVSIVAHLGEECKVLVTQCAEQAPSLSGWETYLSIVFEEWRKRQIRETLYRIYYDGKSADEMLSDTAKLIEEQQQIMAQKRSNTERGFADAVTEIWNNFFTEDTAIKTDWALFDRVLGGFQRGGLYVIAGRPGDGKSDFGIMLATHLAKKYAVDYLSLEMSIEQLTQRIISRVCTINSERLRDKNLTEKEQQRISYVTEKMYDLKLCMDDVAPVTLDSIRTKLELHRPDVLFVDYLGLIKLEGSNNKPQWERIGAATHTLKSLARKHSCAIILLAQLNRAVDKQTAPTLSDLRGGTDIEADADGVLFLRPKKTDGFLSGDDSWPLDLIIAKNRHGGTGKLRYTWQPQYHNYISLDKV